MQLVPKYLLNNSVSLTANLAGEVTEYRTVYQRNINVYRGIDTSIQFNVLNADQKPVSILNTYTPKFKLYDENNRLIVERDGTVLETSTPSKVGHFSITISENDLLNIPSQYLSYSVFLHKTGDNSKNLVRQAISDNANYIAIGAFFVSKTKKVKFKANIELLNYVKNITNIPIVAIGGIKFSNYKKLLLNKANFLAISGYIWNNKKYKPLDAIKKLK